MMRSLILVLALSVVGFSTAFADEVYKPEVRVTPLFKGTQTSIGQPIHYPEGGQAEASMIEVILPPGAQTGWHTHPVPGFAYVVSGTLSIEFEGGKSAQFSAGQGFAEVVDTLHNGRNLGTEPVRLWVVFTGIAGQPFAKKTPAAPAGK